MHPVQQAASTSDSDIDSDCSTSDSGIAEVCDHDNLQHAAAGAKACNEGVFVGQRPTLVQQAAASTIQRHVRQHLSRQATSSSENLHHTNAVFAKQHGATRAAHAKTPTKKMHEAAACIQAWWRRRLIRGSQMPAPLTPPGSKHHMQTSCSSSCSSRPDSAMSITTAGLSHSRGASAMNCAPCSSAVRQEQAMEIHLKSTMELIVFYSSAQLPQMTLLLLSCNQYMYDNKSSMLMQSCICSQKSASRLQVQRHRLGPALHPWRSCAWAALQLCGEDRDP